MEVTMSCRRAVAGVGSACITIFPSALPGKNESVPHSRRGRASRRSPLGLTDPTQKSALFFKLHQLQVLSWGTSTVGGITQTLDFEAGLLESTFDTVIFGLTVIPIVGWFKLLPTFGGRVLTEADGLRLEDDELVMELQRTKVLTCPGVPRIPLVDGLFMDRWYPVNPVWKLLPWNGGPFDGRPPLCRMRVVYVDEQMRVSRDVGGGLFVYTRPMPAYLFATHPQGPHPLTTARDVLWSYSHP